MKQPSAIVFKTYTKKNGRKVFVAFRKDTPTMKSVAWEALPTDKDIFVHPGHKGLYNFD